ncbi:MAG: TolC family protein [Gammaproteobacteria bacterium]|nr:TolC family protein [Gammaproteobacteria bacterium]
MTLRALLITLLTISGAAPADQPANPSGLLPTAIARPLLEQDPGVAAARAGLEVALQDAGLLDKSPYEWIASATTQERKLDHGPRYGEWSLGIERTFRLPRKAAADRGLGQATIEESEANYGEALHEAARELLTLWLDWLTAERSRELATSTLQATKDSLAAVHKRVTAGDASKLEAGIAGAELATQRGLENVAKTQASAAWARLSTRFPGITRQSLALPSPSPIGDDAALLRERILAESDELKIMKAQVKKSEFRAARAHADRIPDPTIGVHTVSESAGREQIAGISLSIPIPGAARDLRSARAIAAVEVSNQDLELKKRQIDTEVASAIATARGAYESLQIANDGARSVQENTNLMQRAYALGEAELQALLLTRRQVTAALESTLQAQVAALKAYYGLLLDAHLIWDLEHD